MRWIGKTLAVISGMAVVGIACVQAAPSETAFPRFTQAQGKLDADGLRSIELHLNRHLRFQVIHRITKRFVGDVDLLVR